MKRLLVVAAAGGLVLAPTCQAVNFPFESVQLTDGDVRNYSAVAFGNARAHGLAPGGEKPQCRAFPGSEDWPSTAEWDRLNGTLDGALLRPTPAAAACYPGEHYDKARCQYLLRSASATRFYLDDPLTALTQWTQGNTCLATLSPEGNCTQGGFPEYVVNATTVKQIQAAVNFARNKNVRLIIKNTGHDFGGRSSGAGSLSVWTHYLKDFEFLPEYSMGPYRGMAVRYGAGVEAWELYMHMGENGNISVAAPGGATVGANGGWFAAGGHGFLTSRIGLGADQALSIQVVTAEGRLVTADPFTNTDLFYALRGGGGSTYGIMTSVVMKAYPLILTVGSSLNLDFNNDQAPQQAGTNNTPPANKTIADVETFWKGVSLYYRFGAKVAAAGGMCFGYIYPLGNGSFSFTTSSTFLDTAPADVADFMQPLYEDLARAGIEAANQPSRTASVYGAARGRGTGDGPTQTRYRSRLFPRANWADDGLFDATMRAVRRTAEAGYKFHHNMHSPTREAAGWPGRDGAVNPAYREAVMHAMLMEDQPVGLTAAQARAHDAAVGALMDEWRRLSPGAGAYMNEADPAEPDWQQAFYGTNYGRLLPIKRRRDPWGLFWAPTTVGSEPWEVRAVDDYPNSQNGRLCRVAGQDGSDDAGWDGWD